MFERSQLKTFHKAKMLLFFLGLVVLSVPGFIKSVRAADPPTPGISISSITSDGGTTSNGVHTTSASIVKVSGTVTASAVPLESFYSFSDYPSASTNRIWTKGADTWSDTITFTPLMTPGASFTVTYKATSEAGITQTTSFKITKVVSAGGSTAVTCAVSGVVRNTNGFALAGAAVTIGAPGTPTSSKTTDSGGNYSASVSTTVDTYLSATATLDGYLGVNNWNQAAAIPAPCVLKLDIYLTQAGTSSLYVGGPITSPAPPSKPVRRSQIKLSGKTRLTTGEILPGVIVSAATSIGTTLFSAPSASDGSYSLDGITGWSGTSIYLGGTKSGYTFSAPISYTLPYNDGGYMSDIFMTTASAVETKDKLTGTVYRTGKDRIPVILPGAKVSLSCTVFGATSSYSQNSDAQGHYTFVGLEYWNKPTCKLSASIVLPGETRAVSSRSEEFVPTSGTITKSIFIDTGADLGVTINFPDFYPSFEQINATLQPDTANPNRVAFPFTFTQNGITTLIYPEEQKPGPITLKNLDPTVPYAIKIDANIAGTFGNMAYEPGPQWLQVGPNTQKIDLIADHPNTLLVDITNVDSSLSSSINFSFIANDPTAQHKWTCVAGQNDLQNSIAGSNTSSQSTTLSYKLSHCSRSGVADLAGTSEPDKPLPKSNQTHLIANRFITDKFADQVNSVSFSRYFGETQKITIPYQNINATTYTVKGTVNKGHKYSEGNVKDAYSGVDVSLYLSGKNSNSTSPAVKVCTTKTDNNGEYKCTFTSVQAKNKTTLTISADSPLDSKKTNYVIGKPTYISNFTFITDALSTSCDNNAKYLTQTSDGINQFWFCGELAKSLYADPQYKAVWLAMVEETKTLRHDFSSQAIAPATPPELVINSNRIKDANAIFPKGVNLSNSCWPAKTTPDIPGDEARIEINGGLIKLSFPKSLSDSAKQLRSKSMTAHEFGHLTDFRKGRCKTYSSMIPGSPIQKLFANWKTSVSKARSAKINAILTESNYPGLIGGHPDESETETFASAFDLTNIVPNLLQSRIAAIKSSVSANDTKDKKDLQALIDEVKKK